jgi:hypothetical protein
MEQKQYDELVKLIVTLTKKVDALEYLITEHLGDLAEDGRVKDTLDLILKKL